MPLERENAGQSSEADKSISDKLDIMMKQFTELKSENAALRTKVDNTTRQMTSEDYLDYLSQKGKEQAAPAKVQALDLDTLSGSELADHIVALVKEKFQTEFDERRTAEKKLVGDLGTAFGQVDLEMAKLRHPDFDKALEDEAYRKRYLETVQSNQGWNASRVYKELQREEKERAEVVEREKQEKDDLELKTFAESGDIPRDTVNGKALDIDEAVELAARKVFGTTSDREVLGD